MKRAAQILCGLAILSTFEARQTLAAFIIFTLVFVVWVIFVVIAYALGSIVEAIPAIFKSLIPTKTEEICNDSF